MLIENTLLTAIGLGLAGLAGLVSADFTLTNLPAIESKAGNTVSCGEYDALDRTNVTEWPVLGHDVGVNVDGVTTTIGIRAALADDPNNLVTLRPPVHPRRRGDYCFMRIRGVEEWIGRDALVEVRQYTPGEGYFYRCVAVTFVEGGPALPTCRGFHQQLLENHENRIGEKARLEQRDLDNASRGDDTVEAAVDTNDEEEEGEEEEEEEEEEDVGQEIPLPDAGTGPVSTYTHLPPARVSEGPGGQAPWVLYPESPLPTDQADGAPLQARPLVPLPENEAGGFSAGSILLNLGLVAALVATLSL